ncbi:hypothetical protein PPERSA_00032 [Pseudocohnilembus persalinus]|uniref:Uncharacterized protein n=1 Tax=Pseudocohnilembus persalinus TaxID=266149 RepID=A0A0V0Q890_PSEPJ|nr:hypothetical protein PPERSA_00032 [Pseudocohnilembus persalinus]|eukprot:KRW98373.1 hypothetical protein PPERSA_00032 [Pseudocohnilembus persalinus]
MSNISIQHQNDIEILELSINQWLDGQGIEWADPEEKMESYYQKKKLEIFSVKVELENSDFTENQLTFDNIEQIDSQWEINKYYYELSEQVQFAKSERCVVVVEQIILILI